MYGATPFGSRLLSYGVTREDARQTAHETIMPVEQRLETLELVCSALWSLLKAKTGLTNEELIEAMHTIDAADGVVDGKVTQVPTICPACGKQSLTRRSTKCNWCGADLGRSPI